MFFIKGDNPVFYKQKQAGVAAIMITLGILVLMTTLTLFTARVLVNDQRLYRNATDTSLADNAAQAGFDFALGYLNLNPNNVINGQKLVGTLSNNATYSAVFTYSPDNQTIQIQSTGVSPSAVSTRVITAITKRYSPPIIPMTSKAALDMQNSSSITNLASNYTVHTGGTASFANTAATYIASGKSSYAGHIVSDVTQNDAALAAKSSATLQTEYLGKAITSFQFTAPIQYSFSSNQNVNAQLNGNGPAGKVVYISMTGSAGNNTATIDSNTIVANSGSPTVIVVSGNVVLDGAAVINGSIYATGSITISTNAVVNGLVYSASTVTMSNSTVVNGAVFSYGTLTMKNSSAVTYNRANMDATNKYRYAAYGVVAGSWRDF